MDIVVWGTIIAIVVTIIVVSTISKSIDQREASTLPKGIVVGINDAHWPMIKSVSHTLHPKGYVIYHIKGNFDEGHGFIKRKEYVFATPISHISRVDALRWLYHHGLDYTTEPTIRNSTIEGLLHRECRLWGYYINDKCPITGKTTE